MRSLRLKDVAELVGLAAILLGIYFVYAEIRQNSVIARAELSAQTLMQAGEIEKQFLDADFSAIYLKSVNTPNNLSEVERRQMYAFFTQIARLMIYEYRNYRFGLFAEYDQMPRFLAQRYLSSGFGRAWWNTAKNGMPPDVVSIVDKELSRPMPLRDWKLIDSEIREQLAIAP